MARRTKYMQSIYEVKNTEKYVGKKKPFMRSSWETVFARLCDNNPAIMQWASEPFMIPYRNPFTGKATVYVPDFFIVYVDKKMKKHGEVIEIKPKKETSMQFAKSKRDQAAVILNMAKWQTAQVWCKAKGMKFRIVTEEDIFAKGNAGPKNKKPRKRKSR
jgi:hypothetical protein